jgi:hypothetical protein
MKVKWCDLTCGQGRLAIVVNFGNYHILQGNYLSSAGQFQNFMRTFEGIFKISRAHFKNPCKTISSLTLYHICTLENIICS